MPAQAPAAPLSAPPGRVAAAPVVAVPIPESREPVSIGPARAPIETASSDPVPIVTAAPVAVAVPVTPPAVSPVRPAAIHLRGRLYRSFGDLGRIETDDGLRLEASGTALPTAWCAVQGNPRLMIATAQGVCFYDRDSDGLIETMAIMGRPELGYMELGPFAYARAD